MNKTLKKLSRKLEQNFSISNLYPACNSLKIHYQNFLLYYKIFCKNRHEPLICILKKKKN